VEPEEQPVLPEELGSEPVLVLVAWRVALAVRRPGGPLRNHLEGQLGNGGRALGGVPLGVAGRVLALEPFDLGSQGLDLVKEDRVGEESPAFDDQRAFLGRSSVGPLIHHPPTAACPD
jgi:hypothetical protein